MAKTLPNLSSTIVTLLIFSLLVAGKSQRFSRNLSQETLGLKKEKLSHLHFYFHDIPGGKNPTAVPVAKSTMTKTSPTGFGEVFMIDDPLTVGPDLSSKMVGRAQGIYASAALNELGYLMVLNYVFVEEKYNGSSISILGRNPAQTAVREMPIVGGSGVFRFARGYAEVKTHSLDFKTGSAVVEYNVYVFHY